MTKVEYVQYPYSEIATQIATNFAKQDGLFFDAYDLEIDENIEECHILSTPSKREFPLKTRIDYFNKIRSLILAVSMYRLNSIVLPKKILCEDIPNKRKYLCSVLGEKGNIFKEKEFWKNLLIFKINSSIKKLTDKEIDNVSGGLSHSKPRESRSII